MNLERIKDAIKGDGPLDKLALQLIESGLGHTIKDIKIDAAGYVVELEHASPDPVQVDPFLEKPAWPEYITPRRGGARPGAGRKPIKDEDRKRNVTVSFRVKETTRDAIQAFREAGIDMNAELEKLVARLAKRDTKG